MRRIASATLLALCCLPSHADSHAGNTVTTTTGTVRGTYLEGVRQYLGIPFAAPPTGDRRWRAPQPPTPWVGERDATRPGPACPQLPTPFSSGHTDEDCLYLNVYAPAASAAQAAPPPVIVWIHPGGLGMGAGSDFDGKTLARRANAVVVTFNYRLGALGFMRSGELEQESGSGNYGLQDQQQALRWVQANVDRFGGDPRRVTVMGNSGGSWSSCLHMVSPASAGLFHRAVMQSGSCLIVPAQTPAQARTHADALAKQMGCPSGPGQLACLRAQPAQSLTAASPDVLDLMRSAYPWGPVMDGPTLPRRPQDMLSEGAFNKVPVLTGSATDEGRFFVGYSFHQKAGRPANEEDYRRAAELVGGNALAGGLATALYPSSKEASTDAALARFFTDAGFACPMLIDASRLSRHVPVYVYEFADIQAPGPLDPFMDWRAYHTSELQYLFGEPVFVTNVSRPFTDEQRKLSEQMMAYWGAFAAHGDPSTAQQPSWPRFNDSTKSIMNLLPAKVMVQPKGAFGNAHRCMTWSTLFWLVGRS